MTTLPNDRSRPAGGDFVSNENTTTVPDPSDTAPQPTLHVVPDPTPLAQLLDAIGHPGPVILCTKEPDSTGKMEFRSKRVGTVAEVGPAMASAPTQDWWFNAVGIPDTMKPPKRGSAAQATVLFCLWADLDVKIDGMRAEVDARAVITDLEDIVGVKATAVVHSGHGLQPFWTLEEPIALTDANRAEIAALVVRWENLVGMVAERHGGQVDTVSDLARVLRVPGTTNCKFDTKVPVVLESTTGSVVSLDTVVEALDALDVPQVKPADLGGDPVSESGDWRWAETAGSCRYVQKMISGWAEDSPGPRHPWLGSQMVRLACAHRAGCLTEQEYRDAGKGLVARFKALCARPGDTRDVGKGEVGDWHRWGIRRAERKTDAEMWDELGGEPHQHIGLDDMSWIPPEPTGETPPPPPRTPAEEWFRVMGGIDKDGRDVAMDSPYSPCLTTQSAIGAAVLSMKAPDADVKQALIAGLAAVATGASQGHKGALFALRDITEAATAAGTPKADVDAIVAGLASVYQDKGAVRGADCACHVEEARQRAEAAKKASTWAPRDLDAVLDGTYVRLEPCMMRRTDGRFLLYPGKVHSVHGESESGKSFLIQSEAAQVLKAGGRVLYFDFESDLESVVERLLAFGVGKELIRTGFQYVSPDEPLNGYGAEWWKDYLASEYTLIVVDGVTDAMNVLGVPAMKGDVNDQATQFLRNFPKPLAERTGAAVVLIDHVTKSTEGRGRFAIGGQAKMNGLTGAAYTLEVVKPLKIGAVGELSLRIGKDRPGGVRPHCGNEFRASDRTQLAAKVVVDSTSDIVVVTLEAPPQFVAPEASDGYKGTSEEQVREERKKEAISKSLEGRAGPMSKNAICVEVGGTAIWVRGLVDILTTDGYLKDTGRKGWVSVKPYRALVSWADERIAEATASADAPDVDVDDE